MLRRNFIASIFGAFGLGSLAQASKDQVKPVKYITSRLNHVKSLRRIRLWKLGSLEHNIYPTQKNIDNLADLLSKRDPKKDCDLIWGPDISCEEFFCSQDDLNLIANDPSVKIVKQEDGKLKISIDKEEKLD